MDNGLTIILAIVVFAVLMLCALVFIIVSAVRTRRRERLEDEFYKSVIRRIHWEDED